VMTIVLAEEVEEVEVREKRARHVEKIRALPLSSKFFFALSRFRFSSFLSDSSIQTDQAIHTHSMTIGKNLEFPMAVFFLFSGAEIAALLSTAAAAELLLLPSLFFASLKNEANAALRSTVASLRIWERPGNSPRGKRPVPGPKACSSPDERAPDCDDNDDDAIRRRARRIGGVESKG